MYPSLYTAKSDQNWNQSDPDLYPETQRNFWQRVRYRNSVSVLQLCISSASVKIGLGTGLVQKPIIIVAHDQLEFQKCKITSRAIVLLPRPGPPAPARPAEKHDSFDIIVGGYAYSSIISSVCCPTQREAVIEHHANRLKK